MKRLTVICALFLCALMLAGCRGIHPPRGKNPVERMVNTSAYCACGKCCGWKRTWYGKPVYSGGRSKGKRKHVGITASGAKARPGTIAADTSRYPFGTVMYIPGYGYGRVEDRGGAIKGDRLDLFFSSHRKALGWGRQKLRIKVWYPPRKKK